MLKKLRHKKTAKKIWIVLCVLILPAFVLWGAGSISSRGKKEAMYAGKIYGKNISLLEYQDSFNAVRNLAVIQFGDNLTQMQKFLNLESQAWDRLILLVEAKKRKIKISDQEVITTIQSYPFFQRKGVFDPAIYNELLRFVFHTQPRLFEEQTRQNLMLNKLYDMITEQVTLNDEEIKNEYRKVNEEINIGYLWAAPSDFVSTVTPSPEELQAYYSKNSLEFKIPVTFRADYFVADTEEKIKNVYKKLKKKEEPRTVAKETDIALKDTGPFTQGGPIPGIGWQGEIANMIAKLKVGQLTPAILLDGKYYLFLLQERKESRVPPFEEIKEQVTASFIQAKAKSIAQEKIQACLKKLSETTDFNLLASELSLKTGTTGPLKYGGYIDGIGAAETFWTAADNLTEGTFSKILQTPSGFFIIKTISRSGIDLQKFEAERVQFAHYILARKKQEFFIRFLETLKKKAQQF
jgi:peptidyl-prolyl cis-trans isomerase D